MLKLVHISEVKDDIYISPVRKEKIQKLKTERARRLSLAAEAAYNEVSMSLTGEIIPYQYNEKGKPINDRFFFSLSHSGEYAVCVSANTPVGVDIQKINKANTEIAKRFFSDDEFEYVKKGHNKDECFFEIWTKKEAFVKAFGQGINSDFSKFSVLKDCGTDFELLDINSEYKLCIGTVLKKL